MAICIVLGCLMTIAVAWGCAWFSPLRVFGPGISSSEGVTSDGPFYERYRPQGWPQLTTLYVQGSIGETERTAYGAVVEQKAVGIFGHSSVIENGLWITENQFGIPWRSLSHIHSGGWGETSWFNASNSPAQQEPDFGFLANGLAVPERLYTLGLGYRYRLPLLPLWPGFLYSTLTYGAVVWLMWFALGALRRRLRLRRGLCLNCKYPLGDFTICPECGNPTGREA